MSALSFDTRHFRTALGRFATGVTVVTAETSDGEPVGLTVSSFNSVSLDPPLVLWSLSRNSASLSTFDGCDRYVVNVLSASQAAIAMRFARGTSSERFDGLVTGRAPEGTLTLDDRCAAWFECRNRSQYIEGDHIIMVGEVLHCGHRDNPPLVFHAGSFDLTPANPA